MSDYKTPAGRLYAEGFEAGISTALGVCRAWQAFRDFLNGVDEQGDMGLWQKRVRNAVGIGASMGSALR